MAYNGSVVDAVFLKEFEVTSFIELIPSLRNNCMWLAFYPHPLPNLGSSLNSVTVEKNHRKFHKKRNEICCYELFYLNLWHDELLLSLFTCGTLFPSFLLLSTFRTLHSPAFIMFKIIQVTYMKFRTEPYI